MNEKRLTTVSGSRQGVAFTVTLREDAKYGRTVAFYDVRYPHTAFGQFVSEYCLETLWEGAERLAVAGLCLHGGVPEWSVSPEGMREVLEYINCL